MILCERGSKLKRNNIFFVVVVFVVVIREEGGEGFLNIILNLKYQYGIYEL